MSDSNSKSMGCLAAIPGLILIIVIISCWKYILAVLGSILGIGLIAWIAYLAYKKKHPTLTTEEQIAKNMEILESVQEQIIPMLETMSTREVELLKTPCTNAERKEEFQRRLTERMAGVPVPKGITPDYTLAEKPKKDAASKPTTSAIVVDGMDLDQLEKTILEYEHNVGALMEKVNNIDARLKRNVGRSPAEQRLLKSEKNEIIRQANAGIKAGKRLYDYREEYMDVHNLNRDRPFDKEFFSFVSDDFFFDEEDESGDIE